MTVDVGYYLAKSYPERPCWPLVADVYQRELGSETSAFKTVNPSIRAVAAAFRIAIHKGADGFVQVPVPQQWAVVLLGRTPKLGLHHCGVFVDGAVLHAVEPGVGGVLYQDLASLADSYRLVEFWARPEA